MSRVFKREGGRMKKYNILDDKGYLWCIDGGVATDKYGNQIRNFRYWGHKKFAIDEHDWERRKMNMWLIHALFLKMMMRMSGLKTTIKLSQTSEKKSVEDKNEN